MERNAEMPLWTDEKAGIVGGFVFPTFIIEAPRFKTSFTKSVLTSGLHADDLDWTQEC